MCFNAPSSLIAGGCSYGVAVYLHRRNHPRFKWAALALMGITAMQWVEGMLWLSDPRICGLINMALTVGLIPLALLAQAWGPLLGSMYEFPVGPRKVRFAFLLFAGLAFVIAVRWAYQPLYTQVTPQGYLNWWSPQNPPVYEWWVYSLWAGIIGMPFLLWWRPFWQSLLIVSWGWLWAALSYFFTDNAASNWCFFVSFYSLFLVVYALITPAPRGSERPEAPGETLHQ